MEHSQSAISITKIHTAQSNLLPDNILTPVISHPHLMQLTRRHIHPSSNTLRLLLHLPAMQRGIILGICNCHAPLDDEMGREPAVSVWGVMGVTVQSVSQSVSQPTI